MDRMDRVSCISYILHQSQDENMKRIAIELVKGDITLKEAKLISPLIRGQIIQAESLYKKKKIDHKDVSLFVHDFIFVT